MFISKDFGKAIMCGSGHECRQLHRAEIETRLSEQRQIQEDKLSLSIFTAQFCTMP